MTTLNSRLQLALLNRKKGRNLLEKGFTLVELMIVIVIVGILSAVALPNFLGTRNKAEASAIIAAMTAQGKLCGANMVTDDSTALADTADFEFSNGGVCDGANDVGISNVEPFDANDTLGLRCGGSTEASPGVGGTTCTLTVEAGSGAITGQWT